MLSAKTFIGHFLFEKLIRALKYLNGYTILVLGTKVLTALHFHRLKVINSFVQKYFIVNIYQGPKHACAKIWKIWFRNFDSYSLILSNYVDFFLKKMLKRAVI